MHSDARPLVVCCCTIALLVAGGGPLRAAAIDFDRDIRPILSDRCYVCHGPDAEARQAELRLDRPDSATAARGHTAAIVPGDPDRSEAIRRVFAIDPAVQMPPPEANLALTDDEKHRLKQWVAEGAVFHDHWAFVAVTRPEFPGHMGDDSRWAANAIDAFVRDRLIEQNLRPSPEASRGKLLRRVTLDLTGLPPTLAELDAFLADESPDAYERVVDRLLASPRYGERMAWDWLEAARYADTDGFQGDPTRTMWPWRDWLVGALNENLPFDQFTIDMLAGDLLPEPTERQILATGFNRNHMHNGEGGRIAEETRVENVFDRTETTSTVWLGMTMTCARCHDHKYDPITQREYYQFYAFFNNTSETGQGRSGKAPPILTCLADEQRRSRDQLDHQIADLERQLAGPFPEVDRAQAAWEDTVRQRYRNRALRDSATLSAWRRTGPLPPPEGDITAAFEHAYFPEEESVDLPATESDESGRWRVASEFVDGVVHSLSDAVGATYLYRSIDAPSERVVEVSLGSDDGIKVWLNGAVVLSRNVNRGAAPDQEQLALSLQAGRNHLLLKIVNTGGAGGFYFHTIRESIDGLPAQIARIVQVESANRSDEQRQALADYYRREHSDTWRAIDQRRARLEQQRDAISGVEVMVMDDLADPRATAILDRGTYNKPLGEVTADIPEFLRLPGREPPANRLELARWLVDPAHPLTARVTVNRYWQMFFGTGLVETSEDFGRQGSRPTHPALLDWLAASFVDSGWDVKQLHRRIVTSATYRQSASRGWSLSEAIDAAPTATAQQLATRAEIDPRNRWLGRGSRFRLPSWMLRDQALAAGRLLSVVQGGPSVRPYQPGGVWAEATFGKIRYERDEGESLYRRSLYIFWRRIVGPTLFFDTGKRQTCVVRPTQTNSPLHALTTLNETTYVEASRAMAARVLTEAVGSPEERVSWAFRLATMRQPAEAERDLLVRRWRQLITRYRDAPELAGRLLAVGESPRDGSLDPAEHAAWTVICATIMNLDEVLNHE